MIRYLWSTGLGITIYVAILTSSAAAVGSVASQSSGHQPIICDDVTQPCANGGTCVSLADGSRTCQCTNGWIGATCSVDLDECESSPCKNGGKCINLLHRKYECECPTGFIGAQCEYPDPCLSHKCHEGATCTVLYTNWTQRTCTCPPGFTGDDCSQDLNECELARTTPCLNGGRCENTPGSYRCHCLPGYLGHDCSERNYANCRPNPCFNGGTCVLGSSGSEICVCPIGFGSDRCQTVQTVDCRSEPCLHGGWCVSNGGENFTCDCRNGWGGDRCATPCAKDNWCLNGGLCAFRNGSIRCLCSDGFRGNRCDIPRLSNPCSPSRCLNGATCISVAADFRDSLAIGGTSSNIGPEENSFRCRCRAGFQGRHCESHLAVDSFGETDDSQEPWADCPPQLRPRCRTVFADGHCDHVCASSGACLHDGFDCAAKLPQCPAGIAALCSGVFGDGVCDRSCNTTACQLDGGDCLVSTSAPSQAVIALSVNASSERLKKELPQLLRQLSGSLRLILRNEGDIKDDSIDGSLLLSLRAVGCIGSGGGDGGGCHLTSKLGREAGRMLTELMRRKKLQPLLPVAVLGVLPQPPTTLPPSGQGKLVALLIGLCSLMACALLAGVLYMAARRRRIASRGIWYPPGFRSNAGSHHVGAATGAATCQDSSSMSFSLSSSSSPLETMVQCSGGKYAGDSGSAGGGGSVTCRLLTSSGPTVCKRAKYEDTPFDSSGLLEPLTSIPSTNMSMAATMATASASTAELSMAAVETPLHLAARHCRADATRHLLETGSDSNAADQFGRTPLHLAIASGAHGAALLLMSSVGTDLNARADDGSTPLIVAAKYCELDIASSLLACPQVDPSAADNNGKTALHWAASVNSGDLVSLLLCRGANRDPPDSQERTPLFLAAHEGAAGAAARLLEAGANRDACDACGRSPAQAAEARLHMDIARMLRSPLPMQPPPPPPPPPPPLPPQSLPVSHSDYHQAQQHYPLHHYPTPPSHTGLEDSPPQMQHPLQPPPVPPHKTGRLVSYSSLQPQYQQLPSQQQQQQHLSAGGFLTPSPDSGQDSPGQSSGTSFAATQFYFSQQQQQHQAFHHPHHHHHHQQQQQQVLQPLCYEDPQMCYATPKREVL